MVAVQIRNVSPADRDALAAEARARGVSLQTFLRELLAREAKAQRQRAWLDEVTTDTTPVTTDEDVVARIRRDRERDA